jgi:hypothetical protein
MNRIEQITDLALACVVLALATGGVLACVSYMLGAP